MSGHHEEVSKLRREIAKLRRNPTVNRIAQNEARITALEQAIGRLVAHLLSVNSKKDKDDDSKLNWTGTHELHVLCNIAMRVVAKKP